MRVALITDGIYPYVLGGMQKHSFYLTKYFAKHQIHVDLVHFNHSEFNINHLELFSEEEKTYIHPTVIAFPISYPFPGHYIWQSYQYSCLAYAAIKHKLESYDFIYTKGFSGWKLISEKHKGNAACCKIGINFHGYEMFQIALGVKAKLQQLLLRPFVQHLSRKADVVFSYGGPITSIIQSLGVTKDKIVEMPSGVESSFINSHTATHDQPYKKFVFLGRAERRKGIVELTKVLHQLIAEKKIFQFDFIGPVPDYLKIQHPCIIYHGEIRDSEKIKEILSQADTLVCPSWSEGFPNVILEGMACGLSVIASNVGAISIMLNSQNGWLIKPADEKELYQAMLDCIHASDLTAKKEKSLQLIREVFNWDVISHQMVKAISSQKTP